MIYSNLSRKNVSGTCQSQTLKRMVGVSGTLLSTGIWKAVSGMNGLSQGFPELFGVPTPFWEKNHWETHWKSTCFKWSIESAPSCTLIYYCCPVIFQQLPSPLWEMVVLGKCPFAFHQTWTEPHTQKPALCPPPQPQTGWLHVTSGHYETTGLADPLPGLPPASLWTLWTSLLNEAAQNHQASRSRGEAAGFLLHAGQA